MSLEGREGGRKEGVREREQGGVDLGGEGKQVKNQKGEKK